MTRGSMGWRERWGGGGGEEKIENKATAINVSHFKTFWDKATAINVSHFQTFWEKCSPPNYIFKKNGGIDQLLLDVPNFKHQ